MLSRLRKRLTYSNIAATLAVFFAMSGGAYKRGEAARSAPKGYAFA
jgi:hypothetical protein